MRRPLHRRIPGHPALAVALAALGLVAGGIGVTPANAANAADPANPAKPATVVGTAVVVVNDVRQTPPAAAGRPVHLRDSIVLETRIDTGRASAFTMTYPPGGRMDLGEKSAGVFSRQEVDAATGKKSSWILLLTGKLRLALRKLAQQVTIETPEAVSGVKGTVVRFLVAPLVGTFVAVDEGVVSVRSKAGGEPVDVAAGQWVLVPPGGLPTRPAPLDHRAGPLEDPPLIDRFDLQFEQPKPPVRPPG